ncbi:MAG: fibronectin type III domain-containing protein [Thermoplasmata archaeon]
MPNAKIDCVPFVSLLTAFLLLMTTLAVFSFFSSQASAESWSDDFGAAMDPRWEKGGIGASGTMTIKDQFYLYASSFDPQPYNIGYPIAEENLPLWYGPTVRTTVSLASDFTVEGIFKCEAETTVYNVGKLEIRLLDSSHTIIHAFGWADTSNSTNMASLYVRGPGGQVIHTTGESSEFSHLLNKPLSISRSGDEVIFLMDGVERFRGQAGGRALRYVEIAFQKHKEFGITMCTPNTMWLNSISVQTVLVTAPSAPLNLASITGSDYVRITWQQPESDGGSPLNGYRVYRGTESGALELLTVLGNVLSYNDTGVTSGSMYFYAVSAVNELGEGPLSNEISSAPQSVPSPPTNLIAIGGSSSITLTWSPPLSDGGSPITGYVLYKGVQASALGELSRLANILTYSDLNVSSGVRYFYSLSALTNVGEGPKSTLAEAFISAPGTSGPIIELPSEPRTFEAKPGDGKISLSWSPPSFTGNSVIFNYTVYRGFNPDTIVLHKILGDVLTYSDTGLANGQGYYYRLTATNSLGEGPCSETLMAAPVASTVPSPPHDPALIAGDGFVQLNWSRPLDDGHSAITGYRIYRGTVPGNLSLIQTLGPALSYADTNLLNGQIYYYKLYAVNSMGEGLGTDILNAMPESNVIESPDIPATDNPDATTGGWSINSSIVTVALLGVTMVAALIFLRKPGAVTQSDSVSKSKGPDQDIDDQSDGDAPNEEGQND